MSDDITTDHSPLSRAVQEWFRAAGGTVDGDEYDLRFHVELDELMFDFEDFSDEDEAEMELLGTVLLGEAIGEDEVTELLAKLGPLLPDSLTLDVQDIQSPEVSGVCVWTVLAIEGENAGADRLNKLLAELVDTTGRMSDIAEHFVNARRIMIPPADPA